MIVVTVESLPRGSRTHAKPIARVFISNRGETNDLEVQTDLIEMPHLGVAADNRSFVIENHDEKEHLFRLLAKIFTKASEDRKTAD